VASHKALATANSVTLVRDLPASQVREGSMAKDPGGGAEQKRRATSKSDDVQEDVQASADVTEKGEELKEELDALLDEIDEVLEENAEEFVKQYVQKGGQ
jgi:ubiquitin-like protein Pup